MAYVCRRLRSRMDSRPESSHQMEQRYQPARLHRIGICSYKSKSTNSQILSFEEELTNRPIEFQSCQPSPGRLTIASAARIHRHRVSKHAGEAASARRRERCRVRFAGIKFSGSDHREVTRLRMTQFFAVANSCSKSTISLTCTRNQRSIFVRLKISSMVKPVRRAWRSVFQSQTSHGWSWSRLEEAAFAFCFRQASRKVG